MTFIAKGRKATRSSPRRLLPMPRNALGRGLGALIREPEPKAPPESAPIQPQATTAGGAAVVPTRETVHMGPREVDIDLVEPSPYQPRTRFREEALDELARSIRASGIIQPLVVRPIGSRFQLIAGERRWRAAQRAGLNKVTVIVKQVPDELALEMTLVENIQREDLNAIEAARAFERLMDEFHLTQESVAERTGKDRATAANAVCATSSTRRIDRAAGRAAGVAALARQSGCSRGSPRREHQVCFGRTPAAPRYQSPASPKNKNAAGAIGAGILRRTAADGNLRPLDEIRKRTGAIAPVP